MKYLKRLTLSALCLLLALGMLSGFAAKSTVIYVGEEHSIPREDSSVVVIMDDGVLDVDEDGLLTALKAGETTVSIVDADGAYTDYTIVVKDAGKTKQDEGNGDEADQAPEPEQPAAVEEEQGETEAEVSGEVYTTREEVVAAVSKGARQMRDAIEFTIKMKNVPSSQSGKQAAVQKLLPNEEEVMAPFAKQVYFSITMETDENGNATTGVVCSYEYREGKNVLKKIQGKKAELTEKQQTLYDKIMEVSKELKLSGDSPKWKKALAAHDYLVLNSVYDTRAAANESYNINSYDAYGLMTSGTGVCQAYSESFLLLMATAGVDCDYVTGYFGKTPHSWNRVKLDDNKWYNIDCTFDDSAPDKPGVVEHDYFAVTDKQLRKDHQWTDNTHTCTATKYAYKNIK